MTRFNRSVRAVATTIVPLAAMLVLAGCEPYGPSADDVYMPTASWERHPIEVVKKRVGMDVKTAHGRLGPAQADKVARFAQSASGNRISSVYVRRPTGGGNSRAVAADIVTILKRNGVSGGAIVQSTYEGGPDSPVLVSYSRKVAVTRECGDWSMDLAGGGQNDTYPNFGCAAQNNLAAMVSDPQDLETPRAQTPSDPMRRSTVFDKYRAGESTVTTVDTQQQQIAISTVAQQ